MNQEMGEVLPTVMGNEIDLIISEEVKLIASEQFEIAHQYFKAKELSDCEYSSKVTCWRKNLLIVKKPSNL